MKLQTKFQNKDFEKGEVVEADIFCDGDDKFKLVACTLKGRQHSFYYRSLKKLNEEWEDVPEGPKEYHWLRSGLGDICETKDTGTENDKFRKSIGNYFETREEAEKAVEKLKAWKRLKDKGFEFLPEASFIQRKTDEGESLGSISFRMDDENDFIWGNNEDLKILFGGGK